MAESILKLSWRAFFPAIYKDILLPLALDLPGNLGFYNSNCKVCI